MTPASLLISLAGISQQEAANFLDVRLDTVKSWCRKNNPNQAKPGIIDELKSLIAHQAEAADQTLALIADLSRQNGASQSIELGYPADDYAAQTLGLPCVGAWRAMAGRVIARSSVLVRMVPRGSTLATVKTSN